MPKWSAGGCCLCWGLDSVQIGSYTAKALLACCRSSAAPERPHCIAVACSMRTLLGRQIAACVPARPSPSLHLHASTPSLPRRFAEVERALQAHVAFCMPPFHPNPLSLPRRFAEVERALQANAGEMAALREVGESMAHYRATLDVARCAAYFGVWNCGVRVPFIQPSKFTCTVRRLNGPVHAPTAR